MSTRVLGKSINIQNSTTTFLKSVNLSNTSTMTFNSNSSIVMNNTSVANLPALSNVFIGNSTNTLQSLITSEIPFGCIIIWTGTLVNVPGGWMPCHGGSPKNGIEIPDLRDLFIICTTSASNVGVLDGNSNNSVLVTQNNLPTHTHTGNLSSENASHNHVHDLFADGTGGPDRPKMTTSKGTQQASMHNTSDNRQNHNHDVFLSSVGGTTPIIITPPYYSLLYIIFTGA